MKEHKWLELGEKGVPDGLEECREEINDVAKIIFDKIKHYAKCDREAILDIVRALSNVSN